MLFVLRAQPAVLGVTASPAMSLDHNRVPAGSQSHLELAMMLFDSVRQGSYVGPRPEGSMEVQQGWAREVNDAERPEKDDIVNTTRVKRSVSNIWLLIQKLNNLGYTAPVTWHSYKGTSGFRLFFPELESSHVWDASLLTVCPAKYFFFLLM